MILLSRGGGMAKNRQGPMVIGQDLLSKGLVAMRMAERQAGERLKAKRQHYPGPCPFLTCLLPNAHDHWICPECGAVRFGNASCGTCKGVARAAIKIHRLGVRAVMKRARMAEARLAAMREREGKDGQERGSDQDST